LVDISFTRHTLIVTGIPVRDLALATINVRSDPTPDPVNTWMGDCMQLHHEPGERADTFKLNVKKVEGNIALNGTPTTERWDVTCRTGSPSVTCYPTQVNKPRPNPNPQAVLDLPTREGWKAELTR